MNKNQKIHEAYKRIINVFKQRPQQAFSTTQGTAIIDDGMKCTFTQGDHSAVMDMPEIMGGDDAGPTPGFFSRAGIAGCVSMGIKQTAIMAGANFDTVSVEVETDFDDGASMGLGGSSAAPLETRLTISIKSDLSEQKVSELVNKALEVDPWFLALRDAQQVKFEITVDKQAS